MQQTVGKCLKDFFDERSQTRRKRDLEACKALMELAEILFYASLATEEKAPTRVSIAWARDGVDLKDITDEAEPLSQGDLPSLSWTVFGLESRELDVKTLVKAAPLTEYGRSALVVHREPSGFKITGIARRVPGTDDNQSVLLSAPEPGVLSIFLGTYEFFRYERGQAKPIPPLIFEKEGVVRARIDEIGKPLQRGHSIVQRLVTGMSSTKHGGLLLFLPQEPTTDDLEKTKLKLLDCNVLAQAIKRRDEAHSAAFLLMLSRKFGAQDESEEAEKSAGATSDSAELALTETIRDIARLTAVDNALLLGPGFQVIGAQFEVPSESAPKVYRATDAQGTPGDEYDLKLHGSRHRAAACFAASHPGGLAFVSSADGPIKCFLSHEGQVVMWDVRLPEV